MTEKEPPAGEKDAETMDADDPYDLKGVLKRMGGSQSDHWNKVLRRCEQHGVSAPHDRPREPSTVDDVVLGWAQQRHRRIPECQRAVIAVGESVGLLKS